MLEQQAAFRRWNGAVLGMYDQADQAMARYDEAVGKDRFTAYSEISSIRKVVEATWLGIDKYEPSQQFSKKHKKVLSDALDELEASLYYKKEGLDKALKFLDDPRPSFVEGAKQDFAASNGLMMSGITKIVSVKSDLGLLDED